MTSTRSRTITDAWARTRTRLTPRPEKTEELGAVRFSVSEQGWQATLQLPNEPAQTTAESWIEANVPVSVVEAIRRAVRTISRAQRERIGSVRLAVADPAILLVDNRSARIRSTDPAVIAQVGCQELGTDAVLYGFVQFGQSSEYEVTRGVYAFVELEQVKAYLSALDTLAPRLVELVPSPLLELADAEIGALAAFELRSHAATFMLADPDTGTVLFRELQIGRNDFVTLVANATSVSPRDAAEGLQRRVCFQPEAGWAGAAMPMTATERALTKQLGTLKTELSSSLEHFIHHRLANAPAKVVIKGEVDRIRGLSEWLARSIGVPAESGTDLHERFTQAPEIASRNLLETSPSGMLTIGKTEYRFADGRFCGDQSHLARAASPTNKRSPGRVSPDVGLAWLRHKGALPIGIALALTTALWLTLGHFASPLQSASSALAAAQADDGVLRAALLRRVRSGAAPVAEPALDWFDKLVAIANAMPDDVRLAKLSVGGADPAVDDKLVLEGEAVITNNKLAEISGIIDHLATNPTFMRGVNAITFGGADMPQGVADGRLHFTINVNLTKRASGERLAAPGRG